MILQQKPSGLLPKFIEDYKSLFDIDEDKALRYIKSGEHFNTLTDEWYQRLSENDINGAYRVYNDDYYFTDIWNCFVQYSRRYLRDLTRPCLPDGSSFIDATKNAKVIVDVGCGIGYATTILSQLYPNAQVYGTNLKNTKQWQFCQMMANRHGFKLIESINDIDTKIDIIFASEYFEHFINPSEHVKELIDYGKPEYLVIANAFNTRSIGHFIDYQDNNKIINQKYISRHFNQTLIKCNYKKLKTNLYNNKPNIWKFNDKSQFIL